LVGGDDTGGEELGMRANDAECTRAGQPMTDVALALTTARKEHLSPMQISLSLSLSLSRCAAV
jgi:hypothetical protein